ncbi:isoleucine--tRNA ligase, partial [bacterium]|nr:isoleucine--tRNA ligase [bacterium]
KRDIETYGIAEFVNRCKERVWKYAERITDQSIRLGYWMDWDNSYYTMSDENNYTIWRFLKKCHERGKVYRGHDVMPWCPRCGTGLSQHEMHEGYKTVKDLSIFARFPVVGRKNEYFLVWTTTPWTLSSNTAIAVNPELEYAKVRQGDDVYYLSNHLVKSVVGRKGDFEIVETMKGSAFDGWLYSGPFDENENQKIEADGHPVIFWDEVAEAEGTGIVHIAPGCGKEDFELGKKYDLPMIAPIDESGVFLPGFGYQSGQFATDVTEEVVGDLKDKAMLFATEKYEHSYPHCWRCGTALLFRAVDEWFINMDWRDEIKEVAKQITWYPGYGLDLELDWLTNMRDWMISKKRYWGLALPIWVCGDCDHFDVIGSREELAERAVEGWDEFDGHTPHRPYIDGVRIACSKCGGASHRIRDVGNPWLDAGIVPYSTTGYNADRDEWAKWIPADLVLECFPGQFRNWFYSMLAMSTMLENMRPFKRLVGHALVRDENGKEMHKSAGNAIWFDDAAEAVGVDVLRWMYCRQETATNLNFGYTHAKEIRGKFVNTYWNTYAFYVNYARIAGFVPDENDMTPVAERNEFDRWILDRLAEAVAKCRNAFDNYNLRASVLAAEEFLEDLSNWYIRHNRERFWGELTNPDVKAALETLYTCVDTLTRLIAPVMPMLTESIYQNMVRSVREDAPASVHHRSYPSEQPDWVDEKVRAQMGALKKITSLLLAAREGAKQRVRQPLAKATIGPADLREAETLRDYVLFLTDTLNVKEVEITAPGADSPATTTIKPNFRTLGKKLGPKMKAFQAWLSAEGASEVEEKLAKGESPFFVTFEDESFEFESADFTLETHSPEGMHVVQEGPNWVMLDTVVTPELEREGVMRDLLRKLQMLRKEVNLNIEDRCEVVYATDDSGLTQVIEEFLATIKEELLCSSFIAGDPGDGASEIKVGDATISVKLTKHA